MEKVRGLISKLVVTEQSWDVKRGIGNTVNNILVTMYVSDGCEVIRMIA